MFSVLLRVLIKQRRFDRLIQSMDQSLAQPCIREVLAQRLHESLAQVRDTDSGPLRKGQPDLQGKKREWAAESLSNLSAGRFDEAALSLVEQMTALDPRDDVARQAWLCAFRWLHFDLLNRMQELSSHHVALHMSCKPRLERAQASVDSFASVPTEALSHLMLVGHGAPYALNESSGILAVPALDTYEHLPSKVLDAYALLAFVPRVQSVVKMDDDHRLGDSAALLTLMDKAATCRQAVQWGHVYHTPFPAAHSHGWHLGKCKDPTFAEAPFGFPAPLSWATGEFGYVLNRPALLRMLWARLYYRRWLSLVMYEDIALGEIADKLGIDKRAVAMDRALKFHQAY
jgi:hypothetical protein